MRLRKAILKIDNKNEKCFFHKFISDGEGNIFALIELFNGFVRKVHYNEIRFDGSDGDYTQWVCIYDGDDNCDPIDRGYLIAFSQMTHDGKIVPAVVIQQMDQNMKFYPVTMAEINMYDGG
jgi:hypothetical protein